MEAIATYKSQFKPSQFLNEPYVTIGVPLVAADTDKEAERLATSAYLRHLRLMRGKPIFVPQPVESMDGHWTESERYVVESRMTVAVIGGPDTVRDKIDRLLTVTGANEMIFTSDLYDHNDRLRSFEIGAAVMKELNAFVPVSG
jgi:alkanesulfonate monooxygenase SsuD/methylene tetrahydromethanopterin reductase-like flavin-dependent oxidoreductase (luciferase family)